MEKKQLNQEELKKVIELQNSYSKVNFEIGEIEIRKRSLEKQLNELKQNQDYLFKDFENLQQEEAKISQELEQKYGKGKINIDNGEITPFD